jgi:hypothetical protein
MAIEQMVQHTNNRNLLFHRDTENLFLDKFISVLFLHSPDRASCSGEKSGSGEGMLHELLPKHFVLPTTRDSAAPKSKQTSTTKILLHQQRSFKPNTTSYVALRPPRPSPINLLPVHNTSPKKTQGHNPFDSFRSNIALSAPAPSFAVSKH